MRRILIVALICAIAIFALASTAAAAYVPDNEVCENRDGRQLIIRTYTLAPGDDPESLTEDPFEREGFVYSCVSIVKEEVPFERREQRSETVTVETQTDDLAAILAKLDATLMLDCGEYSVILTLDHTSLNTEATGYSTRSYTISDTKTIEGLDRNDPSDIPKTTVKNGTTLSLQNIEWSVQSAALADDALIPAQYMAIATYSANASYTAANGYITTATYTGEALLRGIESVEYTITYFGEPVPVPEPEPEPEPEPDIEPPQESEPESKETPLIVHIILICAILGLLNALTIILACLIMRRRGVVYVGQTGHSANALDVYPTEQEDFV